MVYVAALQRPTFLIRPIADEKSPSRRSATVEQPTRNRPRSDIRLNSAPGQFGAFRRNHQRTVSGLPKMKAQKPKETDERLSCFCGATVIESALYADFEEGGCPRRAFLRARGCLQGIAVAMLTLLL